MLGVKLEVDFFSGLDGDVAGEEAVQSLLESLDRDVGGGAKAGDLAQRVDPGIGPSGTDQGYPLPGHDLDLLFDELLNGENTGLHLPPVVVRSVVLDDQFDIAQTLTPPLPCRPGRETVS